MSKKETEFKRIPAIKRSADGDEECSPDSKPVQKKKLSFGLSKPLMKVESKLQDISKLGLKMKLATPASKKEVSKQTSKLGKPASAFADDEADEEEMPPEAKMRMKNIGRETPTSSGPNSFGKTKMGFCDVKKIFEKQISDLTNSSQEGGN